VLKPETVSGDEAETHPALSKFLVNREPDSELEKVNVAEVEGVELAGPAMVVWGGVVSIVMLKGEEGELVFPATSLAIKV
jgi:hypothetical protein